MAARRSSCGRKIEEQDGTYDRDTVTRRSKVRNVFIRSVAAHEARAATQIQAVYRSTASRARDFARRNMRRIIQFVKRDDEVDP